MTTEGRFDIEYARGIPIVRVTGEVDLTNVQELDAALDRASRADQGTVVVAMAETSYFDSKGVRALLQAAERLSVTRQQLVVVAPAGAIARRILEIAGAAEALPLFETVEAALTPDQGVR
ncbi:MAG: STAS domain-containing protein [bacterium]